MRRDTAGAAPLLRRLPTKRARPRTAQPRRPRLKALKPEQRRPALGVWARGHFTPEHRSTASARTRAFRVPRARFTCARMLATLAGVAPCNRTGTCCPERLRKLVCVQPWQRAPSPVTACRPSLPSLPPATHAPACTGSPPEGGASAPRAPLPLRRPLATLFVSFTAPPATAWPPPHRRPPPAPPAPAPGPGCRPRAAPRTVPTPTATTSRRRRRPCGRRPR